MKKISKILSLILTLILIISSLPVIVQASEDIIINTIYLTVDTDSWTNYQIGNETSSAAWQLRDCMNVEKEDECKYFIDKGNSGLSKVSEGSYQGCAYGTLIDGTTDYKYDFSLECRNGYAFDTNPENITVYLNGALVTAEYIYYNEYWESYSFAVDINYNPAPQPETIYVDHFYIELENVNIGGVAPSMISHDYSSIFTVSDVSWSCDKDAGFTAGDIFKGASTYTQTITLTPNSGYEFLEDSETSEYLGGCRLYSNTYSDYSYKMDGKNLVIDVFYQTDEVVNDIYLNIDYANWTKFNIGLDADEAEQQFLDEIATIPDEYASKYYINHANTRLVSFDGTSGYSVKAGDILSNEYDYTFNMSIWIENDFSFDSNPGNMNIYINGVKKTFDLDYNTYWGCYTFEIPIVPLLEANITANKTAVNKGDKVTITANVTGGTAPYTYKYAILNIDTGKWSVIKNFSSASSFTYKLDYPGKKQFAVTVKDSNGKTVATNRIDVTVKNPAVPLAATLKSNGSTSAVTINKGESIKFDAVATGGSGSYTYKFAVLNVDTGKWAILKNFSSASSYTCTPSSVGKKQFAVTVKDSNGATVSTNRIDVTVKNPITPLKATLKGNNSTSALTLNKGSNIKLDAIATGGSGSYTYKFAVLNVDTGKWSVLKNFSSTSSYTYALKYPGKKQFAVTVKDSNGTTVATNRINVTVTSTIPLSVTLKANGLTEAITAKVGDNINLSALASGGTAPYTYKYVVRNVDNNSWHTLKDYSSNSNYTVKLSSAGNKEFVVSVKDSKGNVVTSKRIQVTATN